MPTTTLDPTACSPRHSDRGSVGRTSMAEKLEVLGLGASPQATLERLDEFRRLFAFRYTGAVVTRVGQGPKAWTKLPKRLGLPQIVRHLLGDRVPRLGPVWYGARSLSRTRWFCVDVDADRTPEQLLADRYDLEHADAEMRDHLLGQVCRTYKPKPTFAERLLLVERALRRLGINPADPRQVLVQATPSGGRHLYVLLDGDYHLELVSDLLESAGLKHTPGEVELFPAVNRALRLPFGHLPGHAHDPNAWVQFVDDYRNGRIRRFSLAALREHLDRHHDRWRRQARSTRLQRQSSPARSLTPLRVLGVPKSGGERVDRAHHDPADGIRSLADAEALLARGIEQDGTRTQVLNHLAAHLVWFRHQSAEEAAAALTEWAMSPRHRSKDIAADLARGNRRVAAQIETMCRWYAAKKTTHPAESNPQAVRFAPAELDSLRASLRNLSPDDRRHQAEFLLRFLAFAKRHGTPTPDGTARDAAPAINAVVRKWPGCHHMNYKARIGHAVAAGVLSLVKEKWQNPNGPGRARTYRLHVPVPAAEDETLDHAAALALLVEEAGLGGPVVEEKPAPPEENDADHRGDRSDSTQGHPAAVSEEGPGRGLGAGPRQRHPQRDAPDRLPGFRPRRRGTRHVRPAGGIPTRPAAVRDFAPERERLNPLSTRDDTPLPPPSGRPVAHFASRAQWISWVDVVTGPSTPQ